MRVTLRHGLIIAIAGILVSTLMISAALTYWHAGHKLDVEMKSMLAAVQRTIRVALQDIEESPAGSRQVARLIRTYDHSRHVRVELKDASGHTLLASQPAPVAGGMPDWFFRLIETHEMSAVIDGLGPKADGSKIVITADPRNEAGEVWGDIKLHLSTLALFCVLALSILSALLRYALSPLDRIRTAFENMGQGRFGEKVPVAGPAEMEQLAEGFNRMSGLLLEIDDKNRQLDAQLEAVQEEERANLARDLHDEVGPLLFSIDVDATTIRDISAKKSEPRIGERAAAIQDAVAQVKDQVRTILWQLRPGLLLDLGLKNALENLTASLRSRHPGVTFALDVPPAGFSTRIEAVLLAIVREAVNNALKHGKPTIIQIRISANAAGTVEAVIVNDGGSMLDGPATGSLGVRSMQERARIAGGTLTIANLAGNRGVEVKLSLPAEMEAAKPQPTAQSTQRLQ